MAMRTELVGRAGGFAVAAGLGVAIFAGHGCAEAWAAPARSGGTETSDHKSRESSDSATPQAKSSKRRFDSSAVDRSGAKREPAGVSRRGRATPGSAAGRGSESAVPPSRPVWANRREAKPASPVTVTTRMLAGIADTSVGGRAPRMPSQVPGEWALFAAARREFDPAVPKPSAARGQDLAARTVAAAAEITVPPANPADLDTLYTGKPTFITRVITAGLQVVGTVLRPIGGLSNLTPIKVPIFSNGIPPRFVTKGLDVERSEFEGMTVWTLQPQTPSTKYVVALHGGSYAAEASIFHYITYAALARQTGATVVVPDYPLVLEGGTAAQDVPLIADFISQIIDEHGADKVSVLGDSAGGGLAVASVRTLVERGAEVPGRMVLLAPWLDVTMSDPLSATIRDPLLTIRSLRKFGTKWAGDLKPTDPIVSPLFGPLEGLPPTTVFSGSQDLLAADTLRLRDRTIAEGSANFSFVLRKGLIHDFPIFAFLPEALSIRPFIYSALLGTAASHL